MALAVPVGSKDATVTILWQMSHQGRGMPGKLPGVELNKRQAAKLERITHELGSLGPCLPGSVVVRTGRCGKEACSCRNDPPRLHGPFRSWTRKLAGKTVTRLLSEEQLADYQILFDNHRRLKELVHELEDLAVAIVDTDRAGNAEMTPSVWPPPA